MLPTKAASRKTKGQTERLSTRAEPRDSATPEARHDINDVKEGRKFLEKNLLLCPTGEPPTHTSMTTCLYQIAVMSGITKLIGNTIRAVAFLLEDMEEMQINSILKDAFDNQITELTLDMKILIEDAKEKLNKHFKETEGRLTQIINRAVDQPRQPQQAMYMSTLTNPPPHINPRVVAKEGIKARQFLLEGITNTKFSHTDIFQLKKELNNSLKDLGMTNSKICSINKLRNRGALIEMDTNDTTTWMMSQENCSKLCSKIGPSVIFCSRVHNLIAFNLLLGIDPENKDH